MESRGENVKEEEACSPPLITESYSTKHYHGDAAPEAKKTRKSSVFRFRDKVFKPRSSLLT